MQNENINTWHRCQECICYHVFWFIRIIFLVPFVSHFWPLTSPHTYTQRYIDFTVLETVALKASPLFRFIFFLQNSPTFHVSFLGQLLLFILLTGPRFQVVRSSSGLAFLFTPLPWLLLNHVFPAVFIFHHFCSSVFLSLFCGLHKTHLPLWFFFYFYWVFSL